MSDHQNSLAERAHDAAEEAFTDALKDRFAKCASDQKTFQEHFGNAVDELAACREMALDLISKKLG